MKNQDSVFTPECRSQAAAAVVMMPAIPVMYWSMVNGHLLLSMVVAVTGLFAGKLAREIVFSVSQNDSESLECRNL